MVTNTVYYPGCKGIWYSKSPLACQLDHVFYMDEDNFNWTELENILEKLNAPRSAGWVSQFADDAEYFLPTASLILPLEFLE